MSAKVFLEFSTFSENKQDPSVLLIPKKNPTNKHHNTTRVNMSDLFIFSLRIALVEVAPIWFTELLGLIRAFVWKCTFPKYCIEISKRLENKVIPLSLLTEDKANFKKSMLIES